MATFEASRPAVGAQAVGIARAAYEYALDYAKERKQFGRAIIENQAIAFKLADMKMAIDASRLLVWRAAWMGKVGRKFEAGEGSMSKLFAGETAVRVTEEAIQILGGAGYVQGPPRRALAPRLEDLHDLRGHVGDPAPGHHAAPSAASTSSNDPLLLDASKRGRQLVAVWSNGDMAEPCCDRQHVELVGESPRCPALAGPLTAASGARPGERCR